LPRKGALRSNRCSFDASIFSFITSIWTFSLGVSYHIEVHTYGAPYFHLHHWQGSHRRYNGASSKMYFSLVSWYTAGKPIAGHLLPQISMVNIRPSGNPNAGY